MVRLTSLKTGVETAAKCELIVLTARQVRSRKKIGAARQRGGLLKCREGILLSHVARGPPTIRLRRVGPL